MAQAEVNQILEAIKAGIAGRQRNQQLAVQQQNIESESKHREAENKRYVDELAERKRQFDITSKAAQALHDVQIMRAEQEMIGSAKQGIPIPGESVSGSTVPMVPQGMTQVPEGYQLHTLPTGHSVVLPTPETAAQIQANLERITNAPKEEAKTREQAALQEAETARQLKVQGQAASNRLIELQKENEFKAQQQANMIKAQQALHNSEQAMHLRTSMIAATGGLSEPSFLKSLGVNMTTDESGQPTVNTANPQGVVGNYLRDLQNGTLSSDELKKRQPKLADKILAVGQLTGIGALNKDELVQLKDLETVAQVVPIIREMNLIRAQYPTKDFIPGTDAYKKFQADMDMVGKAQPALARIFSGTKRFNAVEMEKYWDALIPRRSPLTSDKEAGFSKYNDFVTKDLQDAFNTITSNLPQGQQAILKSKVGLDRLPYLSNALNNPGQDPGTPKGSKAALPIVKPGEIRVKRKSDGQEGYIQLKDFKTDKYEKVN